MTTLSSLRSTLMLIPFVFCALLSVALDARDVTAQQAASRPELLLVPKADTVLVYPVEPPARGGGVVVYRRQAGAGDYVRVTPEPIRAAYDPAHAAAMLGNELPIVMRAVEASDETEVLRRLQSDRFRAGVLSLVSRRVAEVLGRVYADGGLARGASYEYRVVYVDGSGRETEKVARGTVQLSEVQPAAPTAARAETSDAFVKLSWTYPRYRGSGDLVIGFHVYRAAGTARPERLTPVPILRNEAAPPYFQDDAVTNGIAYRYEVRAVDLAGRESAPATVTARPVDRTPPLIPQDLTTQPGDGFVRLAWRMSPEVDAAGYHVERATRMSGPFTRLTERPLPAEAPALLDSTVVGGTQYFYRVLALDQSGNASAPSNAISAVPEDKTPPAPVSNVTATVVGRRLRVRWTPSPSKDVKGYYIYRAEARAETRNQLVRLMSQPVAATEFVDTGYTGAGLNPGGRYAIRVSAVDHSYNESEAVGAEAVVPDDEAPSPPTGFAVRNIDGRHVEAMWSAASALDIAAYIWTRRGADGEVELGRLPAQTPVLVRDTTVVLGRSYVYHVIAVDSAGNRSAPAVDSVTFREFTPPATPGWLTARATTRGIALEWERVASRDLAGYRVYRSLLPTGDFQEVTREPVSGLAFVDATGRSEHYYVVRAVDESGNLSKPSPAVRPAQVSGQ